MKKQQPAPVSPAAEWFNARVTAVEKDLAAALQPHSGVGLQVIAHAVIDFSGRILQAIAAVDPASRADIETKLNELRLFVAPTDAPRQ